MTGVRIFVSYKSEDVQEVRAVVDLLRANGIELWFAEYEVLSSKYEDFVEQLDDALRQAISSSTHAVIFSNLRWSSSGHCRNELDWICDRFQREPSHVLHVRKPDEDLPHLARNQTEALEKFLAIRYPDHEAGHLDIARAIIKHLVPEIAFSANFQCEKGETFQFAHRGYWGMLRLDGVRLSQSLRDFQHQSDPERARTWQGEIGNIPVAVEVTISPLETILSPWELVDRSNENDAQNLETIDDRAVYGHLRRAARKWLETRRLVEVGLHLFWHSQTSLNEVQEHSFTERLGKMALTCLQRDETNSRPRQVQRHYFLVVVDPWSGAVGQITLAISMPCSSTDEAEELKRFLSIAPQCDRIADSVEYIGCPRKSRGLILAACIFSAGVDIGLLMLLVPSWSMWAKIAVGLAVGIVTTPALLKRSRPSTEAMKQIPQRPREVYSKKNGYSLKIPLGWKVGRGVVTAITNRLGDVDVLLVPVGKKFPQLAVNVAALSSPQRWSDSHMTHEFGERTCLHARQGGAKIVSYQSINVGDAEAFELVYSRPSPLVGPTGFYKAGCFYQGRQFFFQGSCADLSRDVEVMRRVIGSIRIHDEYDRVD